MPHGKTVDPSLGNNSASATVLVLSPATVTATKTVAGSFVEGGSITYTIVLSNSGNFDQQDNPGNELNDVLPGQLTLVQRFGDLRQWRSPRWGPTP